MGRPRMFTHDLVFFSSHCVVLQQHGLSDEVTSEEEEEEEMGEVFVCLLRRRRCLHPVRNRRPSTGSRTLTWTKTWTITT